MILIYILIGVLFIAVALLAIIVAKKRNLVIPDGQELIFKGPSSTDWVIKKVEGQLITGIKQGNVVTKKSTI